MKSKRITVGRSMKRSLARFTAWSFSRWRDYENCPAQAKYRHLDRLPEEEGPPLKRGSAIHAEAEQYLKTVPGKRVRVPKNLAALSDDFVRLRREHAQSEIQLAFDSKWKRTGYFEPNVWARIKIDALILPEAPNSPAEVIDFKTGRYRPEDRMNPLQLNLYGTSILAAYTDRRKVEAALWYTDEGLIVDAEEAFFQEGAATLRVAWNERTEPMFADKRFAPKPGPACRFCPFANSKGGPCELG